MPAFFCLSQVSHDFHATPPLSPTNFLRVMGGRIFAASSHQAFKTLPAAADGRSPKPPCLVFHLGLSQTLRNEDSYLLDHLFPETPISLLARFAHQFWQTVCKKSREVSLSSILVHAGMRAVCFQRLQSAIKRRLLVGIETVIVIACTLRQRWLRELSSQSTIDASMSSLYKPQVV